MDELPGLQARALCRVFGDETAVDDVDLAVYPGEIHAIVGLNGAGKTTLMRMLLGMVRPTTGTALIGGADIETASGDVWARVGALIETPFAYPELTVRENLFASALLHGMPRSRIDPALDGAINRFGLAHWAGNRARTLSLGNRQRLGLVSALIHQPSIVVLDEPANALDPAGVVFIRDMLQELAADGAAVLVSSHHLDQLARVAHRITMLHRGRVVGALDPHGTDLESQFFDTVYRVDLARGAA